MPFNNQRAERQFTKVYVRLLTAIFNAQNAWSRALQDIQILDGVRDNATAFTVKTNNTPVVIGTYNTGANVAFGTGTSSSNRFGNRTEIKYTDTDVPYDYTLAIHEGLDKFTVNEDLDFAVTERIEVQSQAQTRFMNSKIGKFIGTNAGNPITIATVDESNVIEAFSALRAFYVNKEVIVDVTAYVSPAIYNQLMKSDLITTNKNSSMNIDRGEVNMAFGFVIEETPDQYFDTDDIAYFIPDGILLPFVGISTTRAIESEDFDGYALQAAAKGGTYVSGENASVISAIRM